MSSFQIHTQYSLFLPLFCRRGRVMKVASLLDVPAMKPNWQSPVYASLGVNKPPPKKTSSSHVLRLKPLYLPHNSAAPLPLNGGKVKLSFQSSGHFSPPLMIFSKTIVAFLIPALPASFNEDFCISSVTLPFRNGIITLNKCPTPSRYQCLN